MFIIDKWQMELIAHQVVFHLVGTEGKNTCLVDAVRNVIKPNAKSQTEIQFDARAYNIKPEYAKL
jgi:hypothetical protein